MNIIDILQKYGPISNTQTGQIKKLRDFNFKYLGLYFTATWCSQCVKIVHQLPKLVKKINSRGQFLKLITFRLDQTSSNFAYSYLKYQNHTYEQASEIANILGVLSIPSIYVYDILGRLVTRNGYHQMMKFKQETIDIWDRRMNQK